MFGHRKQPTSYRVLTKTVNRSQAKRLIKQGWEVQFTTSGFLVPARVTLRKVVMK